MYIYIYTYIYNYIYLNILSSKLFCSITVADMFLEIRAKILRSSTFTKSSKNMLNYMINCFLGVIKT